MEKIKKHGYKHMTNEQPDASCDSSEFKDSGLTANMEDYMENIALLAKEKNVVRVKDIAKSLNIKMPSVSAALSKLKEKGLINYEKYGHIELTEKGQHIAESVYRRHSFLSDFFHSILHLDEKNANDQACRIEHHLSPEACTQLNKFIEFYKSEKNTHEDWTDRMSSVLLEKNLSEMKEGDRGKIMRILGSGPLKKRLIEMGFRKGEMIRVVKYAPLRDPMEVAIKDYLISLRVKEAKSIIVSRIDGQDTQ